MAGCVAAAFLHMVQMSVDDAILRNQILEEGSMRWNVQARYCGAANASSILHAVFLRPFSINGNDCSESRWPAPRKLVIYMPA
jgi:hypothetical protein